MDAALVAVSVHDSSSCRACVDDASARAGAAKRFAGVHARFGAKLAGCRSGLVLLEPHACL
jgi:hypothetical protein